MTRSLWCFSGFPESFRDPLSSWYAGPKFAHGAGSSVWNGMDSSTRNERSMHDQNLFVEAPNRADFITHKLTDARLDVDCRVNNVTCEDRLTTDIDVQVATASSQREAQVCFYSHFSMHFFFPIFSF